MDNIPLVLFRLSVNSAHDLQAERFIPYITVVFLNAFVDLGHKIVIQNAIFKSYDGQEQVVLTAIVNGLTAAVHPAVLPGRVLADKFAKHRIIRHPHSSLSLQP